MTATVSLCSTIFFSSTVFVQALSSFFRFLCLQALLLRSQISPRRPAEHLLITPEPHLLAHHLEALRDLEHCEREHECECECEQSRDTAGLVVLGVRRDDRAACHHRYVLHRPHRHRPIHTLHVFIALEHPPICLCEYQICLRCHHICLRAANV